MLASLNQYLAMQGCQDPVTYGEEVEFDIETYPNYFLIQFLFKGQFVVAFEKRNEQPFTQLTELAFICQNFCLVGFNSNSYDIPMTRHFLSGQATNESLHRLSTDLVENEMRWWDISDNYPHNAKIFINTYDLIEVAPDPNKISLKMYSARRLGEKLQDLPYEPHQVLTDEEIKVVFNYCIKDIRNTHGLKKDLHTEIDMRVFMSKQFGMDLRSLSDAQIGERVTIQLVERRLGRKLPPPMNYRGKHLRYFSPTYIKFSTALLQNVLETVNNAEYLVEKSGKPTIPDCVSSLQIQIGTTNYKLGIGGLHSQENAQTIICDENHRLRDVDVDSFYPRIIINNRYAPKSIGDVFLEVYELELVNPRLEHKKRSGDPNLSELERKEQKQLANSKKIVINGLYGKLGSPYSKVYAPELMISVCLTGQLSLLMLIERLELQGIKVVSANTDGIIMYYRDDETDLVNSIIRQWERDCNFTTEDTYYHAVYSANVNNYIAVKSDENCQIIKGTKRKGIFADHWFSDVSNFKLKSTPDFLICRNAVVKYLTENVPLQETITSCQDIRQFLSVRAVKGGGEFRGKRFGRIARFYISTESQDYLQYAKNGNKVPKSDNAELLLDIPTELPKDIDYGYYVDYADKMLYDVGYKVKNRVDFLF